MVYTQCCPHWTEPAAGVHFLRTGLDPAYDLSQPLSLEQVERRNVRATSVDPVRHKRVNHKGYVEIQLCYHDVEDEKPLL